MADNPKGNTFFAKDITVCPVCSFKLRREEMLTGRGRLIADKLTNELRRCYKESNRYGEMIPLLYPMTVCPDCLFATYHKDFVAVPKDSIPALQKNTEQRRSNIKLLFPQLDFRRPRTIVEGIASYSLALYSYNVLPAAMAPVIKQALSSLRAAWLSGDMHALAPEENYDLLQRTFYSKACFLYRKTLELKQLGKQAIPIDFHLGPDVDKNWGMDGVLYLCSILDFHYGDKSNPHQRRFNLEEDRRMLARIFGTGKASKAKPVDILDRVRDMHQTISAVLKSDDVE